MRMNKHGVIGLVIICAACYASHWRGAFIPAVALLVILYGAALLIISITGETGKESDAEPGEETAAEAADRIATEKHETQLEAVALHGSFALGMAILLLGFKGQPLISLAMVPLAFIVAHCLTWTTCAPNADRINVNWVNLTALVPIATLMAVTASQKWNPIWYFYAALACYCWLLFRNSNSEPGPVRDRALVSIYLALVSYSLGLLVNINNTVIPHWLNGTAFTYHLMLRIIFLIGCAIAGLAIPFFLVSVRETSAGDATAGSAVPPQTGP